MKVSIFLICMHPNLKIVNYPFKTYKYGELYGFTHFLLFYWLQVRKISVKQIVSPVIFDNMKNPIKGGLYDPAMGPMDIKEKWVQLQSAFEFRNYFPK